MIYASINQYYSAELSQKVHHGLNESYRKGNFTGGFQIFGYKVVDKKNIVDPFEADIVREIFRRFSKGETGKSIANDLISRGVRTKVGHYRFHHSSFGSIRNAFHCRQKCDTVILKMFFVDDGLDFIFRKSVQLVNDNVLKLFFVAVFEHLLECCTIVVRTRHRSVYVSFHDEYAKACGVFLTHSQLSFNGLFRLVLARVSCVYCC